MNETLKLYLLSVLFFFIAIYFFLQIYGIIYKINITALIAEKHKRNKERALKASYEKKEEAKRLAMILNDRIIVT
jgi:hypothetical protein